MNALQSWAGVSFLIGVTIIALFITLEYAGLISWEIMKLSAFVGVGGIVMSSGLYLVSLLQTRVS